MESDDDRAMLKRACGESVALLAPLARTPEETYGFQSPAAFRILTPYGGMTTVSRDDCASAQAFRERVAHLV